MKYYRFIFILGLWFVILPFFAIPLALKHIFIIIPAIFLIGIGIMMSHDKHDDGDKDGLSYEEHNPHTTHEDKHDEDEDEDEDKAGDESSRDHEYDSDEDDYNDRDSEYIEREPQFEDNIDDDDEI